MVKNLLLFTCFILISSLSLFSQEGDCITSEMMPECDIEEISGTVFTNPTEEDSDPPNQNICGGGTFHNPGWFSFVASAEDITIEISPVPGSCSMSPGGFVGVQIALWQGCPDGGGNCIEGDTGCNDEPVTLETEDLVVGEIYNLTIDGCDGSICTVEVQLSTSVQFSVPDLDEVEIGDPEYASGCTSLLGDGIFCAGLPVHFEVDDAFFASLGAEYTWSVVGPDVSTIEWEFGDFSGVGPDFIVGDLDGDLGENGINMVFVDPGFYTICLENAGTVCVPVTEGQTCTEIEIIEQGDQNFDRVSVCALDLEIGWIPDFESENGVPWIGGPIFYDDVASTTDGVINVQTIDACGCDFTQIIQIDIAGSLEQPEVEIYLWECMLTYTWFEEEFDEISELPINEEVIIDEGSSQSDSNGTTCDSLVILTVTPLTMIDSVIIGECTTEGTEFTFQFIALDPDGNEVNVTLPNIQWIDAQTNTVVSTDFTAILETGTYYVEFLSSIEDLNYMTDDLAGIDPTAECAMEFGPYIVVGGASAPPSIKPYMDVFCEGSSETLTFAIDTLPNTEYTWVIPPSYNVIFSSEDSLAVTIDTYVITDTLFVQAENTCGISDLIPLPITYSTGPNISVNAEATICAGLELAVGFDGESSNINSFNWDIPDGVITSGSDDAQNLGITYSDPGLYMYTLTVEDLDGCTSSETFNVEVFAVLENPEVTCSGDQTQIIFTWEDVVGASSYDVIEVDIPSGATVSQTSNSYTISGVLPNDQATIQVISVGNNNCVEVPQNTTCSASACDLSGVMIQEFSDQTICFGDPNNTPVQFDITLPSGFSGLYTGRGVDPFNGLFSPNSPEVIVGSHPVVFDFVDDSGTCFGSFEILITVNPEPNATIVASSTEFCLGESITLSGVDMVATWDFGPDAIGDENNLSYTSPGNKTVLVTVEDPNTFCTNNSMINLNVLDTIEAPVIVCTPGTDVVAFDWQDINGASEYEVSISINSSAPVVTTQSNSDYTEMGLNEGDIVDITVTVVADNGCNTQTESESCQSRVCIVPLIELSATKQTFCSNDIISNPVNIIMRVDGVAPPAGSFTFVGGGISISGASASFDPTGLTPGTYTATFTYTNPVDLCETIENINFEIVAVPIPLVVLNESEICIDETAFGSIPPEPTGITNDIFISNGANISFNGTEDFELDFDFPGIFDFSLTYAVNNCPDITDLVQITVNDTILTPEITCASVNTDFIVFGWSDQTLVTAYDIYIDGVFDSTITDTQFRIDGLDAGDKRTIRVVAIDTVCGNKESEMECMAQMCHDPTWTSNVPTEQCYRVGSGPITLDVSAVPFNPNSTGVLSWLESEVSDNGEFTPNENSQEYNFTAVFTEGNCSSMLPVTFTINVIPTSDLVLNGSDIICEGGSVNVESLFVGTGNEIPLWDFGGGTESGSGFGPYDVTYDTPGTYQITLTIDNEGCIGEQEVVSFVVEPELDIPIVTCSSSDINSVSLTWDAVDCASEYIVLVDGEPISTTTELDFLVTGLTENQEITVAVEAVSECACDNVKSVEITCNSKPCDTTTWTFSDNINNNNCLDVNSQTFTISATPDNLVGDGVGTWSGEPVADGAIGLIDPSLITAGTYDVVYSYEEAGCFYTSPPVQLIFYEEPSLELTAIDPACPDDMFGFITAVGSGGSSDFMYAIDGGSYQSSGNFPDLTIGNHTVNVIDDNGCVNSASISILGPTIPSVEVVGPEIIIIDNNGEFSLDLQNVENIEDVIWTINDAVVCTGSACMSYNVLNAKTDFTIGVTVIYDGGCMVSNELFVEVKEIQAFYIPNTVALNTTDGENNQWKIFIKGSETFPLSINIYDRWGNLIYVKSFPQEVAKEIVLWDGTSNDRDIASGVYVYLLKIQIEDRLETIGGDITILR